MNAIHFGLQHTHTHNYHTVRHFIVLVSVMMGAIIHLILLDSTKRESDWSKAVLRLNQRSS